MHKVFKLQNLECAHCATKMEHDIGKLPGVTHASVSFMTQKLTVEADTDNFDELINQARSICTKYEPDCKIVC